jgi:Na+/H+ antiporter NhaD/arsenite permease-like protein
MWSFAIILALISIKILIVILKINFDFRLLYIALIGMLPIVLFSEKRIEIIKKIDWYTLIFFAAMFILMQSVWQTGIFQEIITRSNMDITSIPSIFAVSIVLSQLISNVPLVALYTPLLLHLGASTKAMVALAAGSTIAGNLLILGAASNVIIIQNAEKQKKTITFIEFAKIGIPLTIINVAVYWAYFMIVP